MQTNIHVVVSVLVDCPDDFPKEHISQDALDFVKRNTSKRGVSVETYNRAGHVAHVVTSIDESNIHLQEDASCSTNPQWWIVTLLGEDGECENVITQARNASHASVLASHLLESPHVKRDVFGPFEKCPTRHKGVV